MKTIELKIYKFEELNKEAQEKAIEKHREFTYQDDAILYWFPDTCKEYAEENGFLDIKNLQYSLSYCQGDGLSFECENFDKDTLVEMFCKYTTKKRALIIYDYLNVEIKGNNGRYCYASKNQVDMYIDYSQNDTENIDKIVGYVLNDLEDLYIEVCNQLEKDGYSEIEYQLKDETLKENLIINDYDFLKNGEMY